jgi:hypothetical protein
MGEAVNVDERTSRRLAELRAEYEAGQRAMSELDTRRAALRDTLLRIAGAIQVLEELATDPAVDAAAGPAVDAAPVMHGEEAIGSTS